MFNRCLISIIILFSIMGCVPEHRKIEDAITSNCELKYDKVTNVRMLYQNKDVTQEKYAYRFTYLEYIEGVYEVKTGLTSSPQFRCVIGVDDQHE